ncbi:MAG: hypothetical protein AAFR76_01400 [Planctomycetota bacterium]
MHNYYRDDVKKQRSHLESAELRNLASELRQIERWLPDQEMDEPLISGAISPNIPDLTVLKNAFARAQGAIELLRKETNRIAFEVELALNPPLQEE